MPRISVIMPVYNVQEYLAQTIESVLNQSYTDFELICIDDCSTDQSLSILKSYKKKDDRIIIITNEQNLGAAATRNRALDIAIGEFVALQDSDDYSHPDRFRIQLNYMDTHPDIIALGSGMIVVDEKNKVRKYIQNFQEDILIRCHVLFTNPISNPTFFIRIDAIKISGQYNNNFKRSQDYELMSRLLPIGNFANLPDYLVYYRRREGQLSGTIDTTCQTRALVRRKICNSYWPSSNIYPQVEIISDVIRASWDNISVENLSESLKIISPLIRKLIKDGGGTCSNQNEFSSWLLIKALRFLGYKFRNGSSLNMLKVSRMLLSINWKILFSYEYLWIVFQVIVGKRLSNSLFEKMKTSEKVFFDKIK
jgi:glycosyltransferase involved in cell wall biosynthesis